MNHFQETSSWLAGLFSLLWKAVSVKTFWRVEDTLSVDWVHT